MSRWKVCARTRTKIADTMTTNAMNSVLLLPFSMGSFLRQGATMSPIGGEKNCENIVACATVLV